MCDWQELIRFWCNW